MRIVHLAAGAGEMYCGACKRDVLLTRGLLARGHDRRQPVELDQLDSPVVVGAESIVADRDLLDRGFRRLTPEARTLIVLRFYLDLPMADVAAAETVKPGSTHVWELVNEPNPMGMGMAHPIHLHGQRFLVLSRNGVPNDNMVWKDTAVLPAGETMDILLEASRVGDWMAHCHIAEHLSAGMMLGFSVVP